MNGDEDGDGYTNIEESLNGTELYAQVFTTSGGQWDGCVQETAENSGVGGTTSSSLKAGDMTDRTQMVSILSFDTASLAEDDVIVSAKFTVTVAGTGNQPWVLAPLVGDVQTGTFGSSGMQSSDFQATATHPGAVTLASVGGGNYEGVLDESALEALNRNGRTEVRVRFAVDDDNDAIEDSVIFSESAPTLAKLTVSLE